MVLFILSSLSLAAYCIYFFWFFKGMFAEKHKICYVVTVAVVVGVELLSHIFMKQFGVILLMIALILSFRLLFRMNNAQALYGGSLFVLSLYSSRAVFAAVYSFLFGQSINAILLQPDYFNTILIFSVMLSITVLSVAGPTFLKRKDLPRLLRNQSELWYLFIYQLILILFFLLVNDGRFWEPRQLWYAILYLFSGILTKVVVLIILQHAIRVSVLIEYEIHTKHLQEQLERQVRHYTSYQKYTESFRKFRHDYKDMMASVKSLVHSGKTEEILCLIDEIHESMQKTVSLHKTYSDHFIVDAILQDTANMCAEKQIRFSANVPYPENAGLSDLEKIRIFSNIMRNAVEACDKLPAGDRYIEITSNYNPDWFFVQIINSYDGTFAYSGGELSTSKADKHVHGFGLKIVKEIVESEMDGILLIETDQEKKEFQVKLSIPLSPPGQTGE
jgi:signal transduction histidine kinase